MESGRRLLRFADRTLPLPSLTGRRGLTDRLIPKICTLSIKTFKSNHFGRPRLNLADRKGVRRRHLESPILKMIKSWDANTLLRSFASIPNKFAATLPGSLVNGGWGTHPLVNESVLSNPVTPRVGQLGSEKRGPFHGLLL